MFRWTIKKKGAGGFTLMEMLIAVFIFSAVISLVYGSYNMTFKVINNADDHSKYSERARVTLERFIADLESYYAGPSGIIKGETTNFGDFRGDGMEFTSTAHLVLNREQKPYGYATIVYTVEEDEDTERLNLYRADRPFIPGKTWEEDDKGFLLCDGLREIAITYVDDGGDENETWEGTKKTPEGIVIPPAMVRIQIGFADDEDTVIYYSTAVAIPRVQ